MDNTTNILLYIAADGILMMEHQAMSRAPAAATKALKTNKASKTKKIAVQPTLIPAPTPAPTPAPIGPRGSGEFARRLHRALQDKQMSASDLAAAIWGRRATVVGGYPCEVARNRERISVYLKAEGLPRHAHLVKIAEALGTTPEALAPDLTKPRTPAAVSYELLGGEQALLRVHTVVPAELALRVARMIQQAQGQAHG